MADAATGSVGDTTAPSTNAACHDMPSMTSWATTATPTIVAITSPMASRLMEPQVLAHVVQRGEEGRRVEQRREHDDEHDVGVELHVGNAGDEAEGRAADDEQDRVGDLRVVGDDQQDRDRGQDREQDEVEMRLRERERREHLDPPHRGHRQRGDALAATHEAHPLAGRCLDVDLLGRHARARRPATRGSRRGGARAWGAP